MINLRASFIRLFDNVRGNMTVELAVFAPVLLSIVVGSFELGRLILVHLKTQNAAASVADLAGRGETLPMAQVQDLFAAAQQIMQPFDLATYGKVILSGVSADVADAPRVLWQVAGGGNLVATSAIGALGAAATMPDSLPMRAKETVVVAEVFYLYGLLPPTEENPGTVIRHAAFFRPRLGDMRSLAP